MAEKEPDISLTNVEIAWIAGLLEGEGSFGLDDRSKDRYDNSTAPPGCYFRISMTDEDVIEKLANLFQRKYFQPTQPTAGNKLENVLYIGDRKTLLYILPLLYPHFGKRRKEQVQSCIDVLNDWQKWYDQGGRSKAARKGGLASAEKARQKKLLEAKSNSEDNN